MKNFISITIAIAALVLSVQAQQVKGKLKTARQDIATAKADLKQAKQDSIAEYNQFKTESFLKIEENNQTIETLKAEKMAKEKAATEAYIKKVEILKNQNAELKESVENYRADGNTNWVAFKREFNRKMEILRQSFLESRD